MVEIHLLEMVTEKFIHSIVTTLNHIFNLILKNVESIYLKIKLISYFFYNLTLKGAQEEEV